MKPRELNDHQLQCLAQLFEHGGTSASVVTRRILRKAGCITKVHGDYTCTPIGEMVAAAYLSSRRKGRAA